MNLRLDREAFHEALLNRFMNLKTITLETDNWVLTLEK
jgi:hypothetical protein